MSIVNASILFDYCAFVSSMVIVFLMVVVFVTMMMMVGVWFRQLGA